MPDSARPFIRIVIVIALALTITRELRRRPEIERRPWMLIAAAALTALLSALVRFGHGLIIGVDYAYPSPADLLAYCAYVLTILAARSFWVRRTRQADADSMLDALIVASAAAVLIYSAILSDYIRDDSIPLLDRLGNVTYSVMTITLIAHVARLAVGPGIRNTAWRLVAAGTAAFVANDLLLLLDTTGSPWAFDVATIAGPSAMVFAMAAVMHPSVSDLTATPAYEPPRLSRARVALLSGALLIIPGALITAEVRGTDPDIPVLATGSVALAALSLGRITLLFRSRERLADLEIALRESGRKLLDATTAAEIAEATAATIELVTGSRTRYAAFINSGHGVRYLLTRPDPSIEHRLSIESTEDDPPDLEELLSPAGTATLARLDLGGHGRLGAILVDTRRMLEHADGLATQTMSAQITQALASLELREARYERRTEQRLKALVEQSSDVVMVVDDERKATFVSPNAERVLGFSAVQLLGTDPTLLVHKDEIDLVRAHLDNPTLPFQIPVVVEARIETASGEYRWFDLTTRNFRHDDEVGGLVITARDVTEERAAKIGLRNSERWFRGLVQNSSDVIAVLDDDGVFKYASPAVEEMLGYTPDDLQGRSALEILSADQVGRLDDLRDDLEAGPVRARTIEVVIAHESSGLRTIEVTLTDLRDDPSVSGLVLNIRDVTDRKQLEEDLRHQVMFDDLTGLGSRVQFTEQLTAALTTGRRPGANVAVLFIDIDDFKNINDTLGHAAGDQVLVEVSSRLHGRLRLQDRAARFGGDEFAVLLTDVYGEYDVTGVADRVLAELNRPVNLFGREIRLAVSIGIAVDDDHTRSAEDLLRAADVAMYRAKDAGKNRWALYERGMADRTMELFELSNALGAAVENDEMMVYYQPIVELTSGRIAGVEALVRWFHPIRGMVSPTSFIPIAERNGLILPLGASVLRKAVAQVAEWRARGHDIYGAVNVSAVQLHADGIVEEILSIVDDSGIDREAVVLELTESALVSDFELIVGRIDALRAGGIRVAIDDFGTGYSTLRYASELSADVLKIDRSFVAKLEHAEQSTIVSTVLSLSRQLGAETVAGGIETPVQHSRLIALGCRRGQGYYFTRPVPPEQITEALIAQFDGHFLVGRAY
ncbi:MAG: putative bifunctional diguanylate cyclase/phosphodiesterase [Acidimicrobiales bacterium]